MPTAAVPYLIPVAAVLPAVDSAVLPVAAAVPNPNKPKPPTAATFNAVVMAPASTSASFVMARRATTGSRTNAPTIAAVNPLLIFSQSPALGSKIIKNTPFNISPTLLIILPKVLAVNTLSHNHLVIAVSKPFKAVAILFLPSFPTITLNNATPIMVFIIFEIIPFRFSHFSAFFSFSSLAFNQATSAGVTVFPLVSFLGSSFFLIL